MICQCNIEAKLPKIFPEEQAAAEAEMAFSDAAKASSDLGNADSAMATFIYDPVISGMDDFVDRTEDHLDKSDVNAAEAGRL
jgi:hypothetical protein